MKQTFQTSVNQSVYNPTSVLPVPWFPNWNCTSFVCGTASVLEPEAPAAKTGTQPASPAINGRVVAWDAVYETPVVAVAIAEKADFTF